MSVASSRIDICAMECSIRRAFVFVSDGQQRKREIVASTKRMQQLDDPWSNDIVSPLDETRSSKLCAPRDVSTAQQEIHCPVYTRRSHCGVAQKKGNTGRAEPIGLSID